MLLLFLSCSSSVSTVEAELLLPLSDQVVEYCEDVDDTASVEVEEDIPDTTVSGPCPEGMQPVPSTDPQYCIDTYEVRVEQGIAISEEGVLPSTHYSFMESRAICEATPFYDETGEVIGYKRMVSLDEWVDAADGTLGTGGSTYPYGNTWQDEVCPTPTSTGTILYNDIQLTGSFPECVSAFGVYDQIGNLWEWVDPLQNIDIDAFFQEVAAAGYNLQVTADDNLWLDGELDALFLLDVSGAFGQLVQGDDGMFYAAQISADIESSDMDAAGYLRFDSHAIGFTGSFLPVIVQKVQASNGYYPIEVVWDRDAAPLTAKVGCAYYAGNQTGCTINTVQATHAYDFKGSIGFRCAIDYPLQRQSEEDAR